MFSRVSTPYEARVVIFRHLPISRAPAGLVVATLFWTNALSAALLQSCAHRCFCSTLRYFAFAGSGCVTSASINGSASVRCALVYILLLASIAAELGFQLADACLSLAECLGCCRQAPDLFSGIRIPTHCTFVFQPQQ